MVKAKKKTKWRSLPLEDCPTSTEDGVSGGASSTKNGRSSHHRMDWKMTNGENNENGFHHNGVNGTKGRQDGSGGGGRRPKTWASHRRPAALQSSQTANSQAETTDQPKKVQFNEDEYTKITTPRQDVLFKKGYLSRPKVHTKASSTTTENGMLSIESTPSSNGVSSIDGEFPYYPSQHYLSDPLMNGSYYGNPVIFMPYPDLYYPHVPQGLETDSAYVPPYHQPFSPPLESTCSDLASPQPLTSTNCSETSELSTEEITQQQQQNGTLSTSSTPPISNATAAAATTIVDENGENDARNMQQTTTTTLTASPNHHSGYEMNQQQPPQPYYAPAVYYVNFDVSQLPYYPYQGINSYDTAAPEFYPLEVALPTESSVEQLTEAEESKTISSSSMTSTTDFSEDDSTPESATKKCKEPVVQPTTEDTSNIFKIAHQSTLNVEVKEFKPKSYEKPPSNKLPKKNGTTPSVPVTTSTAPVTTTSTSNRNRSTLNKKFIRESTKQIEMQNIDLSKSSKLEPATSTIEWVIKGGKRVPIKVAPPPPTPASQTKPEPSSVDPSLIQNESSVPDNITATTTTVTSTTTTSSSTTTKKTTNKKANKPKKNPKNKNKLVAKFEGFVIEEPTFTKTERRISDHAVKQKEEVEEDEDEDEELQEAAMIEEIPWTEAEIETEELNNTKSNLPEENHHEDSDECRDVSKENHHENGVDFDECRGVPEENHHENGVDFDECRDVPEEVRASIGDIESPKIIETVVEQNGYCSESEREEEVVIQPTELPEVHEIEELPAAQDEDYREDFSMYNKMNGFSHSHLNGVPEEPEEEASVFYASDDIHRHTQLETLEEVEEPTSVRQSPESEVLTSDEEASALNGILTTTEDVPDVICEPKKKINGLSASKPPPPPPSITATVCNWLHTFEPQDLKTLFTIPPNADYDKKVQYCNEVLTYFKDEELQDLDKYVNDQFYQYQLCSPSDVDDDEDDDDNLKSDDNKQNTRKKSFGCKIM